MASEDSGGGATRRSSGALSVRKGTERCFFLIEAFQDQDGCGHKPGLEVITLLSQTRNALKPFSQAILAKLNTTEASRFV